MYNAKLIDARDNVVVAIYGIREQETVYYVDPSGTGRQLSAREPIPLFHKIARTDIPEGAGILKYGQVIGIAKTHIRAGEHVHTHNVANRQEVAL